MSGSMARVVLEKTVVADTIADTIAIDMTGMAVKVLADLSLLGIYISFPQLVKIHNKRLIEIRVLTGW